MFTGEKPDLLDIMPFGERSIYVVGKDGVPQHWDGDEWLPSMSKTTRFPPGSGHFGEMLVMLQHMADCVIEGVKPWVGAKEGARVVSTALSCWESMKINNSVKVRNEF